MKINSIINRYIFKEMVPPFVISLAFFLFVFLMTRILDIIKYIVNYRINIPAVLLMLFYSMPYFLQFVIPMSIMMAVLLTFLRLSKENEVVAFKASGFSIYNLLPPVFLFCIMGCFLTASVTIYGIPWGKTSFKKLTNRVAASSFEIGLKERTFNDSFEGIMLYVNKIDPKEKSLVNVFIEDKRTNNIVSTVIAPRGRLLSEPEKLFFCLRLYNGTINQVNIRNKSVNSINFDTYEINIDIKKTFTRAKKGKKHRSEMSLAELKKYLKDDTQKDDIYYRTLMDYHKRFSIPVACIVFGLLAVSLGFQSMITGRSYGLGLGLIFFLLYYLLLTMGRGFGESGAYPPVIGMWAPNIVIGSIGFYLLIRTAKERPLIFDSFINRVIRLTLKFTKKKLA